MKEARAIAEAAARASYGRLVAWLAARTRDVAEAEDALAGAFASALEAWPERGVPDEPEAWLFAVARRKLIDSARRAITRNSFASDLALIAEEAEAAMRGDRFPDERLKLLFVCAHPAIDSGVRTPLMLQTVLGLDAARIASAFLVSPASMGQRLVRAKKKIRDAGLRFETPEPEHLAERLDAVLAAVYAAFGTGWEDADGADPRRAGLADEAIFLGRVIVQLLPEEPEALGLLALMLYAHARRRARRQDGAYVPLDEQDTRLWDATAIAEAETALIGAGRYGKPGRYQLEAAIQSAHAAARLKGYDTSAAIVALYDALLATAPSAGAAVGRAAALSQAGRNEDALANLDALHGDPFADYQPYWAARAHVLAQLGRADEARDAYTRAAGLSEDEAVRRFLLDRKAQLTIV
ncbi:MAG: sigma factor [Amphiplicatus sp.]